MGMDTVPTRERNYTCTYRNMLALEIVSNLLYSFQNRLHLFQIGCRASRYKIGTVCRKIDSIGFKIRCI